MQKEPMTKTSTDSRLLYQQIYQDLESKIATGQIGYMEQIPVLPDLCRIYGVSAAPVRRALDELARAGLIVKRRGRGQGTFAIKCVARTTLRVLLIGDFDIYKSPIEVCFEIFDLLAGIREASKEQGCEVQMVSLKGADTLPPVSGETGYLIISMSWAGYEQGVALAERHQAPYVLVNPPWSGHPCVRVDMEQGAFLGVNYLAQLGHRRIAYLGAREGDWFAPRFSGYQKALAANGLDLDEALIKETDGIDPQQDWDALDTLLALPTPPTALFACSDYRALHLLVHCKRSGILVPQNLSICGYDNINEVANAEPAITSVHHPRQELGKRAVELLAGLIKGEAFEDRDLVATPQLIVRDSCTRPRR